MSDVTDHSVNQQPKAERQAREEIERQARIEADGVLQAAVAAYRRGDTAYRDALLEAGRLADDYLHRRMSLGDSRSVATKALEGELSRWSSRPASVQRLVQCYHAYRLLAEEPGVSAEAVPYRHYVNAWSQLVKRQHKNTPSECWVLLPGREADCRETFARAVQQGMRMDAIRGLVKLLLGKTVGGVAEAAAPPMNVGTAGDVAAMALELVTGGDAPDDTLDMLLSRLADSGELSAVARRACRAALVILRRQTSPSPTEVAHAIGAAERNGKAMLT